VVASTNGIAGIVAPDGSGVERAAQRRQVVLERSVTLVDRRTPATVLGRWPELLLSAMAVVALLASVRLRRRRPSPPAAARPAAAPAGART